MPTRAKPEQPPLKFPRVQPVVLDGIELMPPGSLAVHRALFDGNNEELALLIRRRLSEIEDLSERERTGDILYGIVGAFGIQGVINDAESVAKELSPELFTKPES